eukprot:5943544-Prorocentrum_lima.AAC.1
MSTRSPSRSFGNLVRARNTVDSAYSSPDHHENAELRFSRAFKASQPFKLRAQTASFSASLPL